MADVILDLLGALAVPSTASLAERAHEGDQSHRIAALETQVAALQRTVATLAEVLVRSGVVDDSDRQRVLRAAGRPHETFTADVEEEPAEGGVVGSPYRGGAPMTGLRGCAVCGKRLVADDPELSLAARGAVCTLCFTRGA